MKPTRSLPINNRPYYGSDGAVRTSFVFAKGARETVAASVAKSQRGIRLVCIR